MIRSPLLTMCLATLPTTAAFGAEDGWTRTLENVSQSVVSIRVDRTSAFDTGGLASVQATGFVVDAERGILLTNRHVVSPGPVVAEAVFANNEEVDLVPIYRDPVHDFGLFRFNPEDLQYLEPKALSLKPEDATIGTEIRVVGNDAGEKLSFLSGTIARVDRSAPNYGRGRYNDFNTFYIQAASSTSGGSSGSPVIDRQGDVVALNAGGSRAAASSFYLPLNRVRRALELVQDGQEVTRGTLQATFVNQPYERARRLGLSSDAEGQRRANFPEASGVLSVEQVIPGSPADGKLKTGDLLLAFDGEPIEAFLDVESYLDDHVGQSVTISIERAGAPMEVAVEVSDLHGITPDRYMTYGGGVFHDLSYQMARAYNHQIEGVFVADSGYVFGNAGVSRRALITHLGETPTPTLDAFQAAIAGLAEGEKVQVRYQFLSDKVQEYVAVMSADSLWYPTTECVRSQEPWACTDLDGSGATVAPTPGQTAWGDASDKRAKDVRRGLVEIEAKIPYVHDGLTGDSFVGGGLLVDREKGLVVTDRNTVPAMLADVQLTFARDLMVPAKVVALHPTHNLALVQYDPRLIEQTPVEQVEFVTDLPEVGDKLYSYTLSRDGRELVDEVKVDDLWAGAFRTGWRPRFTDNNLEVMMVKPEPKVGYGALFDKKGRVAGLWGSFSYDRDGKPSEMAGGMPSVMVKRFVDDYLAEGEASTAPSMEVVFGRRTLTEARERGLGDVQVAALAAHDSRRVILAVNAIGPSSPANGILRGGDMLVAVDGEPMTRPLEMEQMLQGRESVKMTLLRDGGLKEVEVPVVNLPLSGTTRIVRWAGATLQDVTRDMSLRYDMSLGGVYVDGRSQGSPASRGGLRPTYRILSVNQQATPSVDVFLEVVAGLGDRDAVRLEVVDLQGRPSVLSLRADGYYWPTWVVSKGEDGDWTRNKLTAE